MLKIQDESRGLDACWMSDLRSYCICDKEFWYPQVVKGDCERHACGRSEKRNRTPSHSPKRLLSQGGEPSMIWYVYIVGFRTIELLRSLLRSTFRFM